MGTYTGTPRTWVAAETVTAAIMNSDIRDPLTALSAAWTSYTPTLTGFTLGNGTIAGAYNRFGKLIVWRASLTFGSTSAGATAMPTFTLPVTSVGTFIAGTITAWFWDTSASQLYQSAANYQSSTTVACGVLSTNGNRVNASTTSPFTWATGDQIIVSGVYEAA